MSVEEEQIEEGRVGWRPVRTKPKTEHIVVKLLRRWEGIEVFCPRIRFQRKLARGAVWFEEALFPGYVIARFDLDVSLRVISAESNVLGVVRFGGDYPDLDARTVEAIRSEFPEESPVVVRQGVQVGEEVEVVDGPLQGSVVTVTGLPSGGERVRILMDFLGEAREVEVSLMSLLGFRDVREFVSGSGG
ncbi:MAG: transcription termination/antitermination NusG family protein [Verrucomicrobiales bacterium]|nr:transcription termination/antitermination NusG family protein [Verrucomicrobiales bacterium]